MTDTNIPVFSSFRRLRVTNPDLYYTADTMGRRPGRSRSRRARHRGGAARRRPGARRPDEVRREVRASPPIRPRVPQRHALAAGASLRPEASKRRPSSRRPSLRSDADGPTWFVALCRHDLPGIAAVAPSVARRGFARALAPGDGPSTRARNRRRGRTR